MNDLSFNKTLWIAGAYALVVTGLYLWGYWGRFGLNVLEYIGIGDIVSHALMPLIASMVTFVFSFVVGTWRDGPEPPRPPAVDRVIETAHRHWRALTFLALVAIGLILRFAPEPIRWFLIAPLIVFALATSFTHLNLSFIPALNPVVIVLTLGIATYSFAQGREDAYDVLNGQGTLLVDVVGSGLQLKSDPAHPVSYVGFISNFFVLYDSEQSEVVFLNAQKINSLALIKNPKSQMTIR